MTALQALLLYHRNQFIFFPNTFSSEGQFWLLTVLLGKLLLCCCNSRRQTIGKAAGELRLLLLMLIAVVSLLAPHFPHLSRPTCCLFIPFCPPLPVHCFSSRDCRDSSSFGQTPHNRGAPGWQDQAPTLCALMQQRNKWSPCARRGGGSEPWSWLMDAAVT